MQKKYYAALLLSMSINASEMDKYFADPDTHKRHEDIKRTTQEINRQCREIPESGGHFTMVERRGMFVIVKETRETESKIVVHYIAPRL